MSNFALNFDSPMPNRRLIAVLVFAAALILNSASAANSPATAGRKPDDLRAVVSALEDEFLAQVDAAAEREPVYDDYEGKLKRLAAAYPGRAEPYFGMIELLEKCENKRAIRLVDEVLGTPDLPDSIAKSFGEIKIALRLVGAPAELALAALDGRRFDLADYAGKVVLIDFWATWCGPCVREIPTLKRHHANFRSAGLEIVGVSFDDDRAKLEKFIAAREIPWVQVHAIGEQREQIAQKWGVTRGYLPTVFLVGRDGRIRYTSNARFRLEEKMAALLREK